MVLHFFLMSNEWNPLKYWYFGHKVTTYWHTDRWNKKKFLDSSHIKISHTAYGGNFEISQWGKSFLDLATVHIIIILAKTSESIRLLHSSGRHIWSRENEAKTANWGNPLVVYNGVDLVLNDYVAEKCSFLDKGVVFFSEIKSTWGTKTPAIS